MIYVGIFDVSCVCNVYMSISSISVNFWELFDLLSNTDVYLSELDNEGQRNDSEFSETS